MLPSITMHLTIHPPRMRDGVAQFIAWTNLHEKGTLRQEICAMADDELQKITQQRKNADTYSIAEQWEETVAKKQDKVCFHYLGDPENNFPPRALSFNDVDGIANQVANWAWKQGLQKGDTVALFFENRPEFVALWLGLAKLGVVTVMD